MALYAWDPTKTNLTGISLSNGNRTATAIADGTDITFISDFAVTLDKFYFEINLTYAPSSYQSFGLCHIDNGFTSTTRAGWSESWAWMGNSRFYHNGSYTTVNGFDDPTVLQFAVDKPNGYIWCGADGAWIGSGDPANGTNPTRTDTTISDYNIYICGTLRYTNDTCTSNFKASQMSYTPPAGFTVAGAAYNISGTAPNGARILLIDETTWQVIDNMVVSEGSYTFNTSSGDKTIVAIQEGKRLTGFNGLTPVGE